MNSKISLTIILIFLMPTFASAQVVISEIMYDLKGSDSGREWIEIQNTGATQIDLSTYKLFENLTNHSLKLIQGTGLLEAGEFAIIADNPTKFLIDWATYTGHLFDSSFSLKNTGEELILRDSNLTDIDSVNYLPDWGGAGDGNSLQKVDNTWVSSRPTAGLINISQQNKTFKIQTTPQITQSPTNRDPWTVEPQIFANAGQDRVVIVGADTEFRGKAFGLKKEPLDNARYIWNFGDGSTQEGQNIFHSYSYPSEYIVILDIGSGKYSASDRMLVKAIPAQIFISAHGLEKDSFIELHNQTKYELDLSFWILKVGAEKFIIPKNTLVSANKKLIISPQATKFFITKNQNQNISLYYPNGNIVIPNKGRSFVGDNSPKLAIKPLPTTQNQTFGKKVEPQVARTQALPTKRANLKRKETKSKIKNEANVLKVFSSSEKKEKKTKKGTKERKKTKENPLFKWLLALFSMVIVSIGGVLFIRHKQPPKTPLLLAEKRVNIDDIEIIEEK